MSQTIIGTYPPWTNSHAFQANQTTQKLKLKYYIWLKNLNDSAKMTGILRTGGGSGSSTAVVDPG